MPKEKDKPGLFVRWLESLFVIMAKPDLIQQNIDSVAGSRNHLFV